MDQDVPTDIRELEEALEAAERDAEALVAGLSEEQGAWRAEAGSWSVAECLDHLRATNRAYLGAMQGPADRARGRGSVRRRPADPGWVGRLFVAMLEPPPRWWTRMPAPKSIRPGAAPPLAETLAGFVASQADVRRFLRANADLDLAGIRFPEPFAPVIRLSLASGLHVIASHSRRHLHQAWRVRRAMERADR